MNSAILIQSESKDGKPKFMVPYIFQIYSFFSLSWIRRYGNELFDNTLFWFSVVCLFLSFSQKDWKDLLPLAEVQGTVIVCTLIVDRYIIVSILLYFCKKILIPKDFPLSFDDECPVLFNSNLQKYLTFCSFSKMFFFLNVSPFRLFSLASIFLSRTDLVVMK